MSEATSSTTNLQQTVTTMHEVQRENATDPVKAAGRMQKGMHRARGGKHAQVVQTARRIARQLGTSGMVTIDDVTLELDRQLVNGIQPSTDGSIRNWKGSVFKGGEWVCIGSTKSRLVRNHQRHIKCWALRTWLEGNTLNGGPEGGSRFNLLGIFHDFRKRFPNVPLQRCTWAIGMQKLSPEFINSIRQGYMTLYEVPVIFVENAIGAVLSGPKDYDGQAPTPSNPGYSPGP